MNGTRRNRRLGWLLLPSLFLACATDREAPLVDSTTPVAFLVNRDVPGVAGGWTRPDFDDAAWSRGRYPLGYDLREGGSARIRTRVDPSAPSIFSRAGFTVADPASIGRLILSVDYDDGFVAWLNGVEVARSPSMPSATTSWNSRPSPHAWSYGAERSLEYFDVSERGIPTLLAGENVLAVGVWNRAADSRDLVLSATLEADPEPVIVRGPYLQQTSANRTVVRWTTSFAVPGAVTYGLSPDRLDRRAKDGTPRVDHAVALRGLSPATRYYYAVHGPSDPPLAGGDERHRFVTAPPPGSERPTRIWIIGDPGYGGRDAVAVRDAYLRVAGDRPADLIVALGDNAYPDGRQFDYQRNFFGVYRDLLRRTAVWPVFGNHDGHSARSGPQAGPYYEIFTLPTEGECGGVPSGTEAYYAFDHANVHFVVLDSDDTDLSPDGPMLSWLEHDLTASEQDWSIVFFHHPPYSKGLHDSDDPGHRMERVRGNVVPILDRFGVAMTFAGHCHSYERSYLLAGHYGSSSTLNDAMRIDRGNGWRDGSGVYCIPKARTNGRPGGTVHTVAGSASQLDEGGSLDHPAMAVSRRALGSVVLDVEGDRISASVIGVDGRLLDHYAIERRDRCPARGDLVGAAGPAG